MPLYVVDKQLDKLNLDAFVLPYFDNYYLDSYYRNNKFEGYSLHSFFEKAKKAVSQKSVLKKNQIVYFMKEKLDYDREEYEDGYDDIDRYDDDNKIPAILTSCKLPSLNDFNKINKYSNNIDENIFEEEKKLLSKFYTKILKTAIFYKYLKISIPIIISKFAKSQDYIDIARQTVRNFIDNSFEEITVYLLLTDDDNDYFSEKERLKHIKIEEVDKQLCYRFYNSYTKQDDTNKNRFYCFNEDQYHYLVFGNIEYCKNISSADLKKHKREKEKLDKEKAEWNKLKRKSKQQSSPNEVENLDNIIAERIKIRDESFSEMVMRKIEENGLNSVYCYKSANVGRNIFSKITKDAKKDENEDGTRYIYRPDKKIALAFAIALHLKQTEAEELLQKAGFSFSNSILDIIVKVFIEKGIYDIDLINQQLLKYDQVLLGSTTRS